MKREYLERMTDDELREYGEAIGISMKSAKTTDAALKLIERRRERCAQISVLGIDLVIPVKRVRDKRLTDLMGRDRTDVETEEAMVLLLGQEQFDRLVEVCTEDDGIVDVDALGFAFVKILKSKELKNF